MIAQSRQEARFFGLPIYQGNPCPNDHSGIRRTCNKACVECSLEYDRDRRANDPIRQAAELARKRVAKRSGRWTPRDPEKRRIEGREYNARVAARPSTVIRKQQRQLDEIARRLDKALNAARERDAREREASYRSSEEYRSQLHQKQVIRSRLKASTRRALVRGFGSHGTVARPEDILLLHQSQGYCCAYCGSPDEPHLDHRHPVRHGGTHELVNLQYLCAPCNMSKRTTPDLEFRIERGIPLLTPWDGWVRRILLLLIAAV